jgi:hypothetical protein
MFRQGTAFLVMCIRENGQIESIGVYSEPHPTSIDGRIMLCLNAFPANPEMAPIPYGLAAKQMEKWAFERLPARLRPYIRRTGWTPELPR